MWYTYVLECADGRLYVGSTGDLDRRLEEHKSGGVTTTSRRLPVQLVYFEARLSKQKAQQRERYFKTGFGRGYLKKEINTPQ
ncbi:MAG: GIY-YIG nuclease family protein [Patescibacteria group bacterium]